ncbi:MAG: hypothetical protein HOP19_12215, partial [Acidobacteria bacterium]|nr:hypothetical protein [Acidobacteriota bacterium]
MKNLIPRFGFFTFLLLASALLVAAQTVDEEMRVDDGAFEGSPVGGTDLIALNRFTPSRYPATLKSIKIYFRRITSTPAGTPFRLVVFGNGLSVAS